MQKKISAILKMSTKYIIYIQNKILTCVAQSRIGGTMFKIFQNTNEMYFRFILLESTIL